MVSNHHQGTQRRRRNDMAVWLMSRIRYLKPGFFTDDDLGGCSLPARILFAGLWTVADREGRLEDRPRRLKVQLLPYDDVDCDELLDELEANKLIIRYEVFETSYIAIPGWSKHQKPHHQEPESAIPEPSSSHLNPFTSQSLPFEPEEVRTASHLAGARNGNWNGNYKGNGKEKEPPLTPLDEDGRKENKAGTQQTAGQVFDELFWPQWPTGGSKQSSKQRFLAASAKERQRILTSEKHYAAAANVAGLLAFTVRAENFIGGRKSYYEEWADGPPSANTNWWKNGNGPPRPVLDAAVERDLQPWQRYCLAWFDEGGWHAQWCRGMTEEEDKGLRDAVEEGRLSRADVIAGRHPCSQ